MAKTKRNSVPCMQCDATFAYKQNLLRHIRKYHHNAPERIKNFSCIKCSICQETLDSVEPYDHIKTLHTEINLSFEEKIFYSMEQFEKWKVEIQCNSKVVYLKYESDETQNIGRISTKFFCNSNDESSHEFNLCPAHITVLQSITENPKEIKVVYQSVHVGPHPTDYQSQASKSIEDTEQLVKEIEKIHCKICSHTFSKENLYQEHVRNFHQTDSIELISISNVTCSICRKGCKSIVDLQNHFLADHSDISLLFEKKIFHSMDQFHQWKKRIEDESQVTFIKRRGDKRLSDGRIAMNYFCYHNYQQDRTQGGSFSCPSHIIAYQKVYNETMEVQVEYQSSHIGHHHAPKVSHLGIELKSNDALVQSEKLINTVKNSVKKSQKAKKMHCSHCVCTFTKKNNLNRHMTKFHPTVTSHISKKLHVTCSICRKTCKSISDLHSHFKSEHSDIGLSFEQNIFYSMEDFEEWKLKIERNSQATFVKHRGDRQLKDGRIAMNFFCCRSSKKNTRFSCPAHIAAYKEMHEVAVEIQVNYQTVHVGHSEESESDNQIVSISAPANEVSNSDILLGILLESKDKFMCSHCVCTFTTKSNWKRHLRKFHPSLTDNLKHGSKVTCSICEKNCKSVRDLHSHFQLDHADVSLLFEEKTFYSMEDFEQWKTEIEHESQSSFIKRRADRILSDGRVTINFFCHRSGHYEPKKDRQRRLKSIGSQKIGFACPAHIVAYKDTYEEVMEIQVKYQSVHVGHECDVRWLPLSRAEKLKLADCLRMGIPKSTVLNNIKKEFSPGNRISLTTRQDLLNICRDFKINNESDINQNDTSPIDSESKKLQNEEENPVLIFLQHFSYGLSDEQQEADNFDCALSIMTNEHEGQQKEDYTVETIEQSKISEAPSIEEERAVVVSELQNLFTACESPLVSSDQLRLLRDGISALKEKLAATSDINMMSVISN